MRTSWISLAGVLLAGSLFISSCGAGGADATPTPSAEMIQTQAVATFAAGQTQTALAMPTETPTPTQTPTATPTPTSLQGSPTPVSAGIAPTSSCYGMAFVSDVTIPDNTAMTPGQKFTKTWRVRNNGSCAWPVGSKLSFTGGEAMGASALTLEKAVDTGKEVELSVEMTAPSSSGTHRGNWRMANPNGASFGDEVYVLIRVGGTATITPTVGTTTSPSVTPTAKASASPSVTPTATASPTATQEG
jgi:hypothetical protein